jgi:hypothetical protein
MAAVPPTTAASAADHLIIRVKASSLGMRWRRGMPPLAPYGGEMVRSIDDNKYKYALKDPPDLDFSHFNVYQGARLAARPLVWRTISRISCPTEEDEEP